MSVIAAACTLNFLVLEAFLGGERELLATASMSIGPLAIYLWKPAWLNGSNEHPFQEAIGEVLALCTLSVPLTFAAMLVGVFGAIGIGSIVGVDVVRDSAWIAALAIGLAHFLPHSVRSLIRPK